MRAAALGFLRFYPDETNLSIYSSFKLIAGENLIGRSPECDVQLCYPDISNIHCKIIIAEGDEYSLEDLVGSNGVFKASADASRQRLKAGKEYELVSRKPFYLANKYRCVFEANQKVEYLAVKPVEIDLEDQATVILQDRYSPPSLGDLDLEIKQYNYEEKKISQQVEDGKETRKASLENIKQKENSMKIVVAKEQPKPNKSEALTIEKVKDEKEKSKVSLENRKPKEITVTKEQPKSNKSNSPAIEKAEEKRRSTRNTKSADVVIIEEPEDKSPTKSRSKGYPPEKILKVKDDNSSISPEPLSKKKVQLKPTKSKDKMEEEEVEIAPKKTRSKSKEASKNEEEKEKKPQKDVKRKDEKKAKSKSPPKAEKEEKKAVRRTKGTPEKVIERPDEKSRKIRQSTKKQDVEEVSPTKKSQTKNTKTPKKDEEKPAKPAKPTKPVKTRKSKRNADDDILDEIEADSSQFKKIKVEVKFSQDIKPVTPLKSILKSPSQIFVEEKQEKIVKEKYIKPKEGKRSKEKILEKNESDDDDSHHTRRNACQIMFSGLEKRDLAFEDDKRKLTIMGAKMVDDMEKNFTLLIMDKFKRTIKFLLAVSKGIDVVSYDWVTDSIKESKLLPTSKYIYSDKKAETQYKFKLAKTLEKARNQTEGLLEGHRVYLSNTIKPSLEEIKTLVESMGGAHIKTKPSELRDDTLIILEENDEKSAKYFADMGYFSYTTELLYSTILQQKLDLKHHKISSDN